MAPFACFSPSHTDTLPRSRALSNPRSALAQLADAPDEFGLAGSQHRASDIDLGQRRRSQPAYSQSAAKQSKPASAASASTSTAPPIARRPRSLERSGRRVTKDLIGLPTNFVHVGHAGRPADAAEVRAPCVCGERGLADASFRLDSWTRPSLS